jgi:hypothetical protein
LRPSHNDAAAAAGRGVLLLLLLKSFLNYWPRTQKTGIIAAFFLVAFE